MRLPDFLVIGAAKSGTTSLYFYLRQHPELYLPKEIKEPGYFCYAAPGLPRHSPKDHPYPDLWEAAVRDLPAYAALFEKVEKTQVCGEATPEYLYLCRETIATIRSTYGATAENLKFIAILRNPIDRLWSHYMMFMRDGYESLPWQKAVSPETINVRKNSGWHPSYDYLGYGEYANQVKAFQDAFGKDRLHVILLDEMEQDAERVCRDVYRFLGVRDDFVGRVGTTYNASGKLRYPWLHETLFSRQYLLKSVLRKVVPHDLLQSVKHRIIGWNAKKEGIPDELRAKLVDYYKDDIRRLSDLIEKDLSSWTA